MVWNSRQKRTKSAAFSAVALTAALLLTACGGGDSDDGGATAAPTAEADLVPASLVGLQIEGVEVEAWSSAPFGALRLWDNGTAWSQIEPSKGDFQWKNLDGALANAKSKGMDDILMVLGTTPTWAASKKTTPVYPPYPGANSAPANMADWDNWVRAVVTRYKGQISSYEIWNEANLKQFFNGTPAQMAEMTKRAYDIIKAGDPEATIVSASPALRLQSAFDRFFSAYLTELAKLDWPIDVLALHTYPKADGDPVARGKLIAMAKEAVTAAGAPADLPVWDTELNYGLAGPGVLPKQRITGLKAAGWVVRTYIDNLRYGIERSYWYIWTQKPYALLGIQAYPGSPAEQGFFAVDNWVIGSSFEGCTEDGNTVTCNFTRAGQKSIVAWANTGTAPFTAPEGSTLVCDPAAKCSQVPAGSALTLTEVPVRIYLQA
ncbi:MAG: beta-galactosidase [Actinomycetota bacterium]|nr:beta-galactosidase [Actinomycetota bacterium]